MTCTSLVAEVGARPRLRRDAFVDARPTYRIAAFGLADRLRRLAEIVLRHAHGNRYRFEIAATLVDEDYDLALVDMTVEGGPEVDRTVRRLRGARAVVRVGRRADGLRRDDLLCDRFTLQLLDALNRAADALDECAGDAPRRADPPSDAVVSWPRALVVDGSPTVRRQLHAVLQGLGVDADGVGSPREARDALARRRYDLVFVDVMLPEADGFSLTRSLKRDDALHAIPVVILTSRSSPLDLVRGALAGCSSYLVKPVSLQSLRMTVGRLLAAGARARARGSDAVGATAP